MMFCGSFDALPCGCARPGIRQKALSPTIPITKRNLDLGFRIRAIRFSLSLTGYLKLRIFVGSATLIVADGCLGVLKLTLYKGGYDWEFVAVTGKQFTTLAAEPARQRHHALNQIW